MDSLFSLTSLLGAGGAGGIAGIGSSLQEQFEKSIPGFGRLQSFFKTWFRLDLTTFFTVAALMGMASNGLLMLNSGLQKVYWWVVRFLTASVSIPGHDRLNREVLNWLGANVLAAGGSRVLTAKSERLQSDVWYYRRVKERNDTSLEKRAPVQYLPTFGVTWFIRKRHLFMVKRIMTSSSHRDSTWGQKMPDEYAGAPEGDEPLVIMCLGRSVKPVKAFLEACRQFADQQREAFITVRACKTHWHEEMWDTTILRPMRHLDTVHFDEQIKAELVTDIENYLDPKTRRYYNKRGIPYRRGYLLHGPPGTGKTSLSLALAGRFGLELYLLHMPSVREDMSLERLFTALPPRCIILLEDIDAVGIQRKHKDNDRGRGRRKRKSEDSDSDSSSSDDDEDSASRSFVTLSGLLNVLDGVASQEGRIVMMTSNYAEKLDKALVRPGRIDRMLFLGNISAKSAEHMFLRMYARGKAEWVSSKLAGLENSVQGEKEASKAEGTADGRGPGPAGGKERREKEKKDGEDRGREGGPDDLDDEDDETETHNLSREALRKLALEFASHIPEDTFTPAQLQGYLLNHRAKPERAVETIPKWVKEEVDLMEEAKARVEQVAQERKERREERRKKREKREKERAKKKKEEEEKEKKKEKKKKDKEGKEAGEGGQEEKGKGKGEDKEEEGGQEEKGEDKEEGKEGQEGQEGAGEERVKEEKEREKEGQKEGNEVEKKNEEEESDPSTCSVSSSSISTSTSSTVDSDKDR